MSAGAQRSAKEFPPSILLGPEEAEKFADLAKGFHERHQFRRFVMDFYSAKEVITMHAELDLAWRVLEEIRLNAWANSRDYYADPKGRPLGQRDLARKLDVAAQRVHEAIGILVAKNLIRLKGRIIFLIDDPKGEETENENPNGSDKPKPIPRPSREEIAKAAAFWAKSRPDRFQQYQKVAKEAREKEQEFQQALQQKRQIQDEMVDAWRAAGAPAEEAAEKAEKSKRPTRPDKNSPTRPDKKRNDFPARSDSFADPSGKQHGASLSTSKAVNKLAGAPAPEESELEIVVRETIGRSRLKFMGGQEMKPETVRNLCGYLQRLRDASQAKAVLEILEDKCRYFARRPDEAQKKSWGWMVGLVKGEVKHRLTTNEEPPSTDAADVSDFNIEDFNAQMAELLGKKTMR